MFNLYVSCLSWMHRGYMGFGMDDDYMSSIDGQMGLRLKRAEMKGSTKQSPVDKAKLLESRAQKFTHHPIETHFLPFSIHD